MFVYRSLSAVTALAIAFFLIMLLLGTGSPAPAPAPDADAALLDRVIYHMNSDIDLSCPRWFFWILIGWVTSVFCMVGQDLLARARAGRAPWLASNTYTQDLIHGILWTWQWAFDVDRGQWRIVDLTECCPSCGHENIYINATPSRPDDPMAPLEGTDMCEVKALCVACQYDTRWVVDSYRFDLDEYKEISIKAQILAHVSTGLWCDRVLLYQDLPQKKQEK